MQSPRLYTVAPQSTDSTVSVSEVGQALSGPIHHFPPEPPTSLFVFSDRSPDGSGLQHSVPVSIFAFPPIPLLERTLIKIREDQAEEVIVIAPVGQEDPGTFSRWRARSLPVSNSGGDLLSQYLPDKGVPYHTDLVTL